MKKYAILVADDQKSACEGVKQSLDQDRFCVDTAYNLPQAKSLWDERQHDIIITDLCMPDGMEGIELLQHIRSRSQSAAVIIMTAHGEIDTAVRAMKFGAFDFLSKPVTAEEIEIKVNNAVKNISLVAANQNLSQTIDDEHVLIGKSRVMEDLRRRISIIGKGELSVLITGPHGTGKELVAWAVQRASPRAPNPFIRVNCAAIAEGLIESELFGSEKGSFSGSIERKFGKFQQADRGTIFLDEVGDMSPTVQAKLLRVLESGEITPVGSTKTLLVDVRVIAATNKNLPQMIQNRQFREDLLFRLNGVPIATPSLLEHKEDIPLLVEHFLLRMGRSSKVDKVFAPEAIAALMNWTWPGNIRELKNVIERVILFCEDRKIGAHEIKSNISNGISTPMAIADTGRSLKAARDDFEREYISRVLRETRTVSEAAERLEISRPHLHQKINELGIAN